LHRRRSFEERFGLTEQSGPSGGREPRLEGRLVPEVMQDAIHPCLVGADHGGGDIPLVLAGGAHDVVRPSSQRIFLAGSCPESEDYGTAVA
jgi:hypothetical protein